MSQIQQLIMTELGKYRDQPIKPIDGGFELAHQVGTTKLWFEPATSSSLDFVLCAKAYVETKLSENFSNVRPEILNQMAVCGAFMEEDDLPLRASYCIYENEIAPEMVTAILLGVFGEQLCLANALVMSDLNQSDLKKYRAHLEYPRVWPDNFNSSNDELEAMAVKLHANLTHYPRIFALNFDP